MSDEGKSVFGRIGATLVGVTQTSGFSLVLAARAMRAVFHRSTWTWRRFHMVMAQAYEAGIESLPVTLVVALFIGFLLASQQASSSRSMANRRSSASWSRSRSCASSAPS